MTKPKFPMLKTNVANYYNVEDVDAYLDKLFKDAVKVSSHNQSLWFTDEASEPGLNTHQALLIHVRLSKSHCRKYKSKKYYSHF